VFSLSFAHRIFGFHCSCSPKKVSLKEPQLSCAMNELMTLRARSPLVSDLLPDYQRFEIDHLPQNAEQIVDEATNTILFGRSGQDRVQGQVVG